MFVIAKIIITALLIVIITEVAKLNDRIGALIAALPITTFLILFWLHYENNSVEKISNHAKKKLKKRVFIFKNIKSLTKAIKNYDTKKVKKLRDKSFYKTFVNNGDLKSTLGRII